MSRAGRTPHVPRAGTPAADPAVREQGLLERAKTGDQEAYGELVDAYAASIYTHVYRLVRHRQEAEDLAQEAFLRAYRYLPRFEQGRPFRPWLYTIATNLAYNALRARGRRGHLVASGAEGARPENWETASGEKPMAWDHLDAEERRNRLADAVAQLPEQAAALIHLHYHEGMALRQAGEILGLSETAAKVALHRARKKLRALLEKDAQHD